MKQETMTFYPPPQSRTRKKKHFANYVVFVSIFAVVVYTSASFLLQFKIGIEPSPTLTTCFFSFFGVELVSLAAIKRGKTKQGSKTEDNQNGGNNRGI